MACSGQVRLGMEFKMVGNVKDGCGIARWGVARQGIYCGVIRLGGVGIGQVGYEMVWQGNLIRCG